jgi:hypothetical protein
LTGLTGLSAFASFTGAGLVVLIGFEAFGAWTFAVAGFIVFAGEPAFTPFGCVANAGFADATGCVAVGCDGFGAPLRP